MEIASERLQRLFGYSREDLRLVIAPMASDGQEAIGSMGVDIHWTSKGGLLYRDGLLHHRGFDVALARDLELAQFALAANARLV